MPGTMFTAVVSSRADANRKWYTVPLSFLVHALLFALVVVVPLVATAVPPPTPRDMLKYEMPDVLPVVVPAPPAVSRSPKTVSPVAVAGPPVVAPPSIAPETALVSHPEAVPEGRIEGAIGGLGSTGDTVELPPVTVAPPPAAPLRPGGQIKPPTRIRHVLPEYPYIAKVAGVEGMVMIDAVIGIDGNVENATVIRSVKLLDQAALDAVRAWKYTPTLLNGHPTPVIMTVTVQFKLN